MNDNLNFEQISTLWKVEKRNFVKQSTMSVYLLLLENHLIPAFGGMRSIAETAVQDFVIDKLNAGLSQKSVKDMLIVLKRECDMVETRNIQ